MVQIDRVWGGTERPWGYEWRVESRDDVTGERDSHVLTFPTAPSVKARDAAVAQLLQQYSAQPAYVRPVDPKDAEITSLTEAVGLLTAEKAVLVADKAALQQELALYKPKPVVGGEIA